MPAIEGITPAVSMTNQENVVASASVEVVQPVGRNLFGSLSGETKRKLSVILGGGGEDRMQLARDAMIAVNDNEELQKQLAGDREIKNFGNNEPGENLPAEEKKAGMREKLAQMWEEAKAALSAKKEETPAESDDTHVQEEAENFGSVEPKDENLESFGSEKLENPIMAVPDFEMQEPEVAEALNNSIDAAKLLAMSVAEIAAIDPEVMRVTMEAMNDADRREFFAKVNKMDMKDLDAIPQEVRGVFVPYMTEQEMADYMQKHNDENTDAAVIADMQAPETDSNPDNGGLAIYDDTTGELVSGEPLPEPELPQVNMVEDDGAKKSESTDFFATDINTDQNKQETEIDDLGQPEVILPDLNKLNNVEEPAKIDDLIANFEQNEQIIPTPDLPVEPGADAEMGADLDGIDAADTIDNDEDLGDEEQLIGLPEEENKESFGNTEPKNATELDDLVETSERELGEDLKVNAETAAKLAESEKISSYKAMQMENKRASQRDLNSEMRAAAMFEQLVRQMKAAMALEYKEAA